MKLDQPEIQFIDNYLQKQDIIFADIRAEMIDHIATAVEEKMEIENLDFYDAFKEYMGTTGQDILKSNNKKLGFSFMVFKKFTLFLVKPQMLIVLGLLIGISKLLEHIKPQNYFMEHSSYYFSCLILFIALIHIAYFLFILKKRFYYIEKNGQLLAILYWINMIFLYLLDETSAIYFYGTWIFLYFLLGFILFSFAQIRNFFKLKLNTL